MTALVSNYIIKKKNLSLDVEVEIPSKAV